MWRAARKSDYGTGAAGVVFLRKKENLLWKTVGNGVGYLGNAATGVIFRGL